MIIFLVSMTSLGMSLKKIFWLKLPKKYLRLRGLTYSLCLIVSMLGLKIPLDLSALSLLIYLLIFYSLFIF